ncbi:MAG TPA: hypothetical protein VMU77_02425, partial [Acidimicrobiales bacterium]|nr:hypothetical protein [Acidimicrobiales bacterium]
MQPYRPFPQFTGITLRSYGGWSNYNALQIQVKKNFSHGLWLESNYTWSHALDTNTQGGWSGPESNFQIAQDPAALYGNSLVDQRHAWNGSFIYQLPFGKGKYFLNKGGILNGFLGGWQVSNMWTVLTGEPFTPRWGGQNLDFSGSGTWFPNRVCSGAISNPTIQEWFNPGCFPSAAPGTYGNSGRNILYGPGYFNMDSSLAKSFAIPQLGEQGLLQIRVDATDVLNHPNFGFPNAGVTPAPTAAGTITSALSQRNLQLGARLVF